MPSKFLRKPWMASAEYGKWPGPYLLKETKFKKINVEKNIWNFYTTVIEPVDF